MGRLIYGALTSLDGYIADANGSFDWAAPGEDVHRAVNDEQRGVGTYLYGRRLYETMVAWETIPTDGDSAAMNDYAQIWRAAEKIVYSSTLATVSSKRTSIRRSFDVAEVRRLTAAGDVIIGGAGLAAEAFRAGLVDDVRLYVNPVIVGGGTAALPDGVRLDLTLVESRQFDSGVVYLRYLCRH